MIFAIGVDSDQTFQYFLMRAASSGVGIQPINLRSVVSEGWHLAIPDNGLSWVKQQGQCIALDPTGAYYCRLIDLSSAVSSMADAVTWRGLVTALNCWLEHIPGIVINRPGKMAGHNSSKPLHEYHLAQLGFDVPSSLTTSSRSELAAFAGQGPSIVKTISGVRANARLVTSGDFDAFDHRQGPVHIQRYIHGTDLRVHVVGQDVHVEEIRSEQADYRTASNLVRGPAHVHPVLAEKLVAATSSLGLVFAGWDLKTSSEDGRTWCLEANPMPGYDGYDRRLGGAVTASLLKCLKGSSDISLMRPLCGT